MIVKCKYNPQQNAWLNMIIFTLIVIASLKAESK